MITKYIKGLANLENEIKLLDAAKKQFVVVGSIDTDKQPEDERLYVIYICEKN